MITSLIQIGGRHARGDIVRFVMATALVGVLQGLALGSFIAIIHAMFGQDRNSALIWFGILLASTLLGGTGLAHVTMRGFNQAMTVMATMHRRLGERLVELPLGWFGPETTGMATGVAVRGTLFVAQTMMDLLVPLIINLVTPLTIALLVCVLEWRVGGILLLCVPLVAGAAWWGSRRNARAEILLHQAAQETDRCLLEFADHQLLLRSAGLAGPDGCRYQPLLQAIEHQRRAAIRGLWSSVLSLLTQGAVVQFAYAVVVTYAMFLALSGQLDPIWVIALIGLGAQFIGPLKILSELGTAMQRAQIELDDVVELIHLPTLPEPAVPVPASSDHAIALRKVAFRYDDAAPWLFRGLDLTIAPGTLTALVGPSGCGKTTLLRLMARFWDVTEGHITLGNADIRQLRHADLMQQMSLVFQDVYLFDDTLEANIRMGNPDASDEQIRAAGELACVTGIVERLPDGWKSRVGEGGARLSGGERQRVSIARALLKNAPVLLLDEATSAQDPLTEKAISQAINALSPRITVVVVAHQLNTVKSADNIAFIDQGQVCEQGTHDMLMARNGRYAHFWQTYHA